MHKFHTPYDCRGLTLSQKVKLCQRAKELSYNWWMDELDCNKSFRRQPIEIEFDEALQKLEENSHFVFLHRHHGEREYVEIGFRTNETTDPDYFLWIQVKPMEAAILKEEFNLTEIIK